MSGKIKTKNMKGLFENGNLKSRGNDKTIKTHKSPVNKNWEKLDYWTEQAKKWMKKYDIKSDGIFYGVYHSNRFQSTLGRTQINGNDDGAVCLSSKLLRVGTEEEIEQILLHELAHIKYPDHGREFKKLCKKMGTHGTTKTPRNYLKRGNE